MASHRRVYNQKRIEYFKQVKSILQGFLPKVCFLSILWTLQGLNLRPLPCRGSALPTELKIRNQSLLYQLFLERQPYFNIKLCEWVNGSIKQPLTNTIRYK